MSWFYYFIITILTLAIAIFNLSISSTGSNYKCYQLKTMTEGEYASYKELNTDTTAPTASTKVENNVTYYIVPTSGSNLYNSVAMVIGILYLIIMALSVLLSLILLWLSDLVPEDFVNMGWFKKWTAIVTKIFPPLIVLVHWVVFILIIVFWIGIGIGTCEVSQPATAEYGFNSLKYHDDCITLQIVNSVIFFCLHYVAAIVKDMIYIEPFMYSPIIGKPNIVDYALKTVGP